MTELELTPKNIKTLCRKEQIHHILKKQFMLKYNIDIDVIIYNKLYKKESIELKDILKWFRMNKKIIVELKFIIEWKNHYLPKIQKILTPNNL